MPSISPSGSVKHDAIRAELSQTIRSAIAPERATRNFSHLLVRYLPEIESSWKIKETGLRNEQTKRSGAESWLALEGGDRRRRASSFFDSGADIPGPVITNKFSTRNEVRKRERVNPKVRAKGVAVRALILGRRRTRGGNEEGVESGKRERKITLG